MVKTAGVILLIIIAFAVFVVFPDNNLTRIEGYSATKIAMTNAEIRLSQARATVVAAETPLPPITPPKECNTPKRGENRTVTAVEGDGGIDLYNRCYPGCEFDLTGYKNLLAFNNKALVDNDGDGIPDPEVEVGEQWKCPGWGSEYEVW